MTNINLPMIAIKFLLFLVTFFFQELNSQPNEELEIDRVWSELALSVKKGDFSKYKSFYHEDAVLISQANQTTDTIKMLLSDGKKVLDKLDQEKLKPI